MIGLSNQVASAWQRLHDKGLVTGDMPQTETESWFIRLTQGSAGVIGGLFISAFIFLSVLLLSTLGVVMTVVGALILGVSVLLQRRWGHSAAGGQFALAMGVAGQVALYIGILEWYSLGGKLALPPALIIAGIAITLVVLVPGNVHRLIASITFWFAVSAAAELASGNRAQIIYGLMIGGIPTAVIGGLAAFTSVAIVTFESRLLAAGWHARALPFALASAVVAHLIGAFALADWHTGFFVPDAARMEQWTISSQVAGVLIGVALVVFAVIETRRLKVGSSTRLVAVAGSVVLTLLLATAPGVLAGLLLAALGMRRVSPVWFGLGLIGILIGFASFYYGLTWTLLTKSLVLIGAGVVLLVASWLWHRRNQSPGVAP